MLSFFRKLLELIRFSHTIFALPFALASAALAWKLDGFRWPDLIGILLAMVTARSFAMAVNRLADRTLDARNPRTAARHLPAGTLSTSSVIAFTAVCAAAFIASTVLFLLREPPNPWPLILSVPVLIFLAGYSWTKRFTSLAHYWLGVALALAPLAAWIAIRGFDGIAIPAVLAAGVLFWVAGFDILYACQDAEFDRSEGLHSVPARFGIRGALRIAAASHAVSFGFLVALGFTTPLLGRIYLGAMTAVGLLLMVQHSLVKPDDLRRVNQAFFQVNAIISMTVLGAILIELLIA